MHIRIQLRQTKAVTCYKTDPSFCQGGRPTTDKTKTVFTKANILP